METKDLILKELEVVQNEIARFDDNGLRVKEWCLTVSVGLIAFGVEKHKWLIVLAAVVTTACFAFVEFTYRRFQWRFIRRSAQIEDKLNKKKFSTYEYKVNHTAKTSLGFCVESCAVLKMPHFAAFYIAIIVFAAGCVYYVGNDVENRTKRSNFRHSHELQRKFGEFNMPPQLRP
jgi:hypothetical protein